MAPFSSSKLLLASHLDSLEGGGGGGGGGHQQDFLLQNLTLTYHALDLDIFNITLTPFLTQSVEDTEGGTQDIFSLTTYSPNTTFNTTIQEGVSNLYQVPTGIVVLLSLFYGSISLVAVVGNAAVMWIVGTSREIWTSVTSYFILNLALADIIIGLFSIPFQFQAALLQRWNLPEFMCAFCPFFQTVSVNVSIFTLTAIAVDRYRAIVHPLSAQPSKYRSKVVITFIWLFSVTLAIPNAIALKVTYSVNDRTGEVTPRCIPVGIDPVLMWTYSHIMVGLQFFVPLSVISFAYLRMGWQLWGARTPGNAEDTRDAHRLRKKKKVIKMLFIIVALFAFCWAPLQTYNILQDICPHINRYKFINIIWFCCHWLAMSNSCCNPFIYAIYNERYMREFRRKFRCLFKDTSRDDASDSDRSRNQMSHRYPRERHGADQRSFRPTEATTQNGSARSLLPR